MNKFIVLGILALFLLSVSVSAAPTQPTYRSNTAFAQSHSNSGMSEWYTQNPTETYRDTSNSRYSNVNFDRQSLQYDYRGPMYEKTSTFKDDFLHDQSSKSGFFTSRNKNILRHTVTNSVTERYVGATESLYTSGQNNRVITSGTQNNIDYTMNGGFSYGKQRVFDRGEYRADSYTTPYYYRPIQQSSGSYNWRY